MYGETPARIIFMSGLCGETILARFQTDISIILPNVAESSKLRFEANVIPFVDDFAKLDSKRILAR